MTGLSRIAALFGPRALLQAAVAWHARRHRPPRNVRERRLREHLADVRGDGHYRTLGRADRSDRPL